MKYLLDTHTFIWWDSDTTKLSPTVYATCQNRDNMILLSLVSVWEMQIKIQLGKLKLAAPLADTVAQQQESNGIELLPITLPHILALEHLPAHHRDPFDRLLIVQAQTEDVILLTDDPFVSKYPVKSLW